MHFSKFLRILPLAGGLVEGAIYRRDDGTQIDGGDQTKQFIIEVKEVWVTCCCTTSLALTIMIGI